MNDQMSHADRLYRYAVSADSTRADHLAQAAGYIEQLEAENQRLREVLSFYKTCERCDGDGDEPWSDNDVCGPAPCRDCGGCGQGYDKGKRAADALGRRRK